MTVLFVSNQFPFPPRDGVTLPFCNYIERLQREFGSADLLVLSRSKLDGELRERNSRVFRSIFEVPITSTGTVTRVFGQLIGRAPYFSGWALAGCPPKELASRNYDFVMSTPRAVASLVDRLRQQGQLNARLHVAAVNDVATLAKTNLAASALRGGMSPVNLVRFLKFSLQRIGMHSSEVNLLSSHCDLFVVQSDAETRWVDTIGNPELSRRVVQLSNGVDDQFFEIPLKRERNNCTFVGNISGEYTQRVSWLVDEVWKPLRSHFPNAEFTVSGNCSDSDLIARLSSNQVQHRQFVENPADLYSDQLVLLAPIFKGYGLINKVVQAMASGTLVIGDATAFNAIPEFQPGKHGLVADEPEAFIKCLSQVFRDRDSTNEIRCEARRLVREHFRWDTRVETLRNRLYSLGLDRPAIQSAK